MPVVIYLHGNSSSRLEGLKIATELLKRGINLFVFDFAGCGLSEGEYISLGWHEKEDLKTIVDFVDKIPGVSKIGVWGKIYLNFIGRSMGAATALMYNYSDERICAACYDSPFAEFTKLARELCRKQVKIPNFVIDTALMFVRNSIKKRNGMDLYKLTPLNYASKTLTPGFFVHAMSDELIPLEHSLKLVEVYQGDKSLNVCEGNHNTSRQRQILDKIGRFFCKYLKGEE